MNIDQLTKEVFFKEKRRKEILALLQSVTDGDPVKDINSALVRNERHSTSVAIPAEILVELLEAELIKINEFFYKYQPVLDAANLMINALRQNLPERPTESE